MGAPGTSSGPWTVEDRGTRDRTFRIRCADGTQNGGAGMVVVERVELDHDARQLAASPDLYDALEKLRIALDLIDPTRPLQYAETMSLMRNCADAALAKARGES